MRSPLLLLLVAAVCVPACAPADRSEAAAASVTREQFRQLDWIVGKWRGAEAAGAPFFESYRMMDDSTIAQASWADSTFTSRSDSSMITLRNGHVTNGSAVAIKWDASSVRFEPGDGASNGYAWQKENADRWTAHLFWKDKSGKAQERTYSMTRIAE